jgi:spore maturation protein CgeB
MQTQKDPLYDLTYMGTYSVDRQRVLEEFLLRVARDMPGRRFLVAGPQYPDHIDWPRNVERREHISPQDHAEFYLRSRFTLNVTRADMKSFGFSPSVRLFEAAAAGAPIISDRWTGIETVFQPPKEICLASSCEDIIGHLSLTEPERIDIAFAARQRFEQDHSPLRRAEDLERYLAEVSGTVQPKGASCCCP